jgi:hypothetical protein
MTAQDHQDLDGRWSELGHEPVGEAGGDPARRWPTRLRCNRGGVGDGPGHLLLVQGVGQDPQGGGQLTDRAVQGERDPTAEALAVDGRRRM